MIGLIYKYMSQMSAREFYQILYLCQWQYLESNIISPYRYQKINQFFR